MTYPRPAARLAALLALGLLAVLGAWIAFAWPLSTGGKTPELEPPSTPHQQVEDRAAQPATTPAEASPAPASPARPPAASSEDGFGPRYAIAYIVQPGDTLREIARDYATTVDALTLMNGLAGPDLIYPGQRLLIAGDVDAVRRGEQPVRTVYTVQPGDTLSALAARFGSSVDAIVETNAIDDPDLLIAGQDLVIPLYVPSS